jgi:hypothetical protein
MERYMCLRAESAAAELAERPCWCGAVAERCREHYVETRSLPCLTHWWIEDRITHVDTVVTVRSDVDTDGLIQHFHPAATFSVALDELVQILVVSWLNETDGLPFSALRIVGFHLLDVA